MGRGERKLLNLSRDRQACFEGKYQYYRKQVHLVYRFRQGLRKELEFMVGKNAYGYEFAWYVDPHGGVVASILYLFNYTLKYPRFNRR
jgi:hypothetical protein